MLGLRYLSEDKNLSKKGHPPQRTTGVANANCIQIETRSDTNGHTTIEPMVRNRMGKVSTTPAQKRRVIDFSSRLSSSSAVASRGSKAIPHLGHVPGPT